MSIRYRKVFINRWFTSEYLIYSSYIQGLLTTGLVYQSVIDGNGEQKYSFTPLAERIDCYAVSYNNIERYPTTIRYISAKIFPQPKLPEIPEWKEISANEIDEMFK